MKTLILVVLLVAASANPVPSKDGRRLVQPYYYPGLSLEYPYGAFQPLPASLAYEPASYMAALPAVSDVKPSTSYSIPVKVSPEGGDQIKVVLSVPSVVPPGTSLSVMVNVNSQPAGTTVTVSDPVLTPVAPTPATPEPTRDDAVVVDAVDSGKPISEDEELGFRDPAILEGLLGFNNPKDSPELVLMQVQAQNQALAAKQKKMA